MERKSKILITGITGFIAPHIASELVKRNFEVYGLIRYVTGRRLETPNVIQVFGDLRETHMINSILKNIMPDYVIHLGALSAVSESYDHYNEYMDINLQGTINLAEGCLRLVPNLKQFLFASTSETYGNQESFPIKETAKLRPNSPYAVSKAGATMYLEYMWEAYNFPVTLCVPFNTYGRSDNRHFVTERILTQMLSGQDEIRLGDPDPIRDLLYRDDHVEAYLSVLDNDEAIGEKFNFCTGKGYSIEELVHECAQATGWEGEVVWHTIPARPLDIDTLIGSNEKAGKYLGWHPKVALGEGLRKTIDNLKQ